MHIINGVELEKWSMDTVVIRGHIHKVGRMGKPRSPKGIYFTGWEFVDCRANECTPPDGKEYTVRDLINIVKRRRIKEILDLCPKEEHEFIRKDLEKYVYL